MEDQQAEFDRLHFLVKETEEARIGVRGEGGSNFEKIAVSYIPFSPNSFSIFSVT